MGTLGAPVPTASPERERCGPGRDAEPEPSLRARLDRRILAAAAAGRAYGPWHPMAEEPAEASALSSEDIASKPYVSCALQSGRGPGYSRS